jgi:hypothetical protein
VFKKVFEFFTNKKATEDEKVEVEAPAFSITKVAGGLGTIIAGIAVAATKLEDAASVKVAAIGAGALVMVGYFGLAAVDLVTRQRAAAAKLRWPAPEKSKAKAAVTAKKASGAKRTLVPADDGLFLKTAQSDDEYEVHYAEVEGDTVTIVARLEGQTLSATFQLP